MSGSVGHPIIPLHIEDHLDRLERRLNEAEGRERGTGRRVWSDAEVMIPGATPLDKGIPGWRRLNDGRIELRGRLTLAGAVGNGTVVLRLPGICSPPGDGAALKSWITTMGPCATLGDSPGIIRLDVQRSVVSELVEEDGQSVQRDVIYAEVIAMPPVNKPLTGWIGFDHVVYDPGLYLDILDPVAESLHGTAYGYGREIQPNKWIVEQVPAEFGVAVLGYKNGQLVTIVPGVKASTVPPAAIPRQ